MGDQRQGTRREGRLMHHNEHFLHFSTFSIFLYCGQITIHSYLLISPQYKQYKYLLSLSNAYILDSIIMIHDKSSFPLNAYSAIKHKQTIIYLPAGQCGMLCIPCSSFFFLCIQAYTYIMVTCIFVALRESLSPMHLT